MTDIPATADNEHDHVTQFEKQLAEVEVIAHEMRHLLVRSEAALENEGIRQDMETLERWIESYRRGLSAAKKLATSGAEILGNIKNRLKLAVEEQYRLEGESPNAATKNQAAAIEDLVKASRRLERMIPTIEQMFLISADAIHTEDDNHASGG